jgi:hypothetical protein
MRKVEYKLYSFWVGYSLSNGLLVVGLRECDLSWHCVLRKESGMKELYVKIRSGKEVWKLEIG